MKLLTTDRYWEGRVSFLQERSHWKIIHVSVDLKLTYIRTVLFGLKWLERIMGASRDNLEEFEGRN